MAEQQDTFLARHRRGDLPLALSFWTVGCAATALLIIPYWFLLFVGSVAAGLAALELGAAGRIVATIFTLGVAGLGIWAVAFQAIGLKRAAAKRGNRPAQIVAVAYLVLAASVLSVVAVIILTDPPRFGFEGESAGAWWFPFLGLGGF